MLLAKAPLLLHPSIQYHRLIKPELSQTWLASRKNKRAVGFREHAGTVAVMHLLPPPPAPLCSTRPGLTALLLETG